MLDTNGDPVAGAEVLIAGLSTSRTNRDGIAKFYLPVAENYAVSVTANGVQEVLYEEAMEPGKTYVYQPDPAQPEGRYFVLTEGWRTTVRTQRLWAWGGKTRSVAGIVEYRRLREVGDACGATKPDRIRQPPSLS